MSHIPIISAEEVIRVGNSCTIYSVELLRELCSLSLSLSLWLTVMRTMKAEGKGRERETFATLHSFSVHTEVHQLRWQQFHVSSRSGAKSPSNPLYSTRCTCNPSKVSKRFGYIDSSLQRRQKCDVAHLRNDSKFIVDCTFFY